MPRPLSPVVILFEDRYARQGRNFGPHVLACACVGDVLGMDRWQLAGTSGPVKAVPLKGNTNVIEACRERASGYTPCGESFVVVVDDDEIRPALGLAQGTCKPEVKARFPGHGSPVLVLLERNVETLVNAVLELEGRPPLTRKDRAERDSVLNRAASPVWNSERRSALRAKVPSFDYLVQKLVEALTRAG